LYLSIGLTPGEKETTVGDLREIDYLLDIDEPYLILGVDPLLLPCGHCSQASVAVHDRP
jgi:hypothetical protein